MGLVAGDVPREGREKGKGARREGERKGEKGMGERRDGGKQEKNHHS